MSLTVKTTTFNNDTGLPPASSTDSTKAVNKVRNEVLESQTSNASASSTDPLSLASGSSPRTMSSVDSVRSEVLSPNSNTLVASQSQSVQIPIENEMKKAKEKFLKFFKHELSESFCLMSDPLNLKDLVRFQFIQQFGCFATTNALTSYGCALISVASRLQEFPFDPENKTYINAFRDELKKFNPDLAILSSDEAFPKYRNFLLQISIVSDIKCLKFDTTSTFESLTSDKRELTLLQRQENRLRLVCSTLFSYQQALFRLYQTTLSMKFKSDQWDKIKSVDFHKRANAFFRQVALGISSKLFFQFKLKQIKGDNFYTCGSVSKGIAFITGALRSLKHWQKKIREYNQSARQLFDGSETYDNKIKAIDHEKLIPDFKKDPVKHFHACLEKCIEGTQVYEQLLKDCLKLLSDLPDLENDEDGISSFEKELAEKAKKEAEQTKAETASRELKNESPVTSPLVQPSRSVTTPQLPVPTAPLFNANDSFLKLSDQFLEIVMRSIQPKVAGAKDCLDDSAHQFKLFCNQLDLMSAYAACHDVNILEYLTPIIARSSSTMSDRLLSKVYREQGKPLNRIPHSHVDLWNILYNEEVPAHLRDADWGAVSTRLPNWAQSVCVRSHHANPPTLNWCLQGGISADRLQTFIQNSHSFYTHFCLQTPEPDQLAEAFNSKLNPSMQREVKQQPLAESLVKRLEQVHTQIDALRQEAAMDRECKMDTDTEELDRERTILWKDLDYILKNLDHALKSFQKYSDTKFLFVHADWILSQLQLLDEQIEVLLHLEIFQYSQRRMHNLEQFRLYRGCRESEANTKIIKGLNIGIGMYAPNQASIKGAKFPEGIQMRSNALRLSLMGEEIDQGLTAQSNKTKTKKKAGGKKTEEINSSTAEALRLRLVEYAEAVVQMSYQRLKVDFQDLIASDSEEETEETS